VALSAQATDAGVNKATRALFQVADTPQKMLDLGEERLIEHIKTIGLFRNKAKNVMKLSRILVEEYGGEVPSSRAALQSLPGVGRKTANVVLNMWWGHPAQAVDTHIFRVGNRAGIAPGKDVDAVERAIEDNVPAEFQRHAHHWLILHGRYTCVARKPKCPACLIRDLCAFEDKTPEPPAKPAKEDPRMSDRYDVVGIGNAIVDVISHGDDSFLENMGITKGIMQLVERERAELLYAAMSDRVQTAGGSVANTIAGVGSLGLSTAFLGKVKDDALGRFYAKGMAEQGTAFSRTRRSRATCRPPRGR
jgi:endonuclease-3